MKTTKPLAPESGQAAETVIPAPPPTPTLNPDDPNAKIVETPLAETLPTPPPAPPVVQQVTPPPAQQSVNVFFKKVNVSLPFFANKKAIAFETLGDNLGVVALDSVKDAETIEALYAAAEAHRGGIVAIDEETWESLKKNHPYNPFGKKSPQPALRVWDSRPPRVQSKGNGNAVAIKPPPASPVVAGVRGASPAVADDTVGAGKSPTVFVPNLQRKSAGPVLRPPASGKFAPGVLPPPV